MNRLVISSLETVIDLMDHNPQLLTLPALQGLRPLLNRPKNVSCCSSDVDMSTYRKAFEGALRSLTTTQQEQMKSILGVDQISYFSNTVGVLEQKSF